jgi:hypothetical protein
MENIYEGEALNLFVIL